VKLIWTRQALGELDAIFAYVARDSELAAAALVDIIERRANGLLTHPEIGRPGRVPGTRELVVAGTPYIIPYRVRDGRVEILAALHASRQWPDKI